MKVGDDAGGRFHFVVVLEDRTFTTQNLTNPQPHVLRVAFTDREVVHSYTVVLGVTFIRVGEFLPSSVHRHDVSVSIQQSHVGGQRIQHREKQSVLSLHVELGLLGEMQLPAGKKYRINLVAESLRQSLTDKLKLLQELW